MQHVTIATILLLFLCVACQRQAPEKEVHRILIERQVTLAIAESCTGGNLTARFTALPGASAYLKGGIVAYSHELKRNLLGIDSQIIGMYGVANEEVARNMAEGARKTMGADYAIATTGIAGPSGGTPKTPVGTVWIAVATPLQTVSKRFFGGKTRSEVITQSSTAAIDLLHTELMSNK